MMATAAIPSFWHSLRSRLDTTAVRATVVLAVLLALAHALTLFLMTESIMRPQAERLAAIMASNVEAIVESARRMPPDQQEQFLKNLWNSPYLRVHLDQEVTPEDTGSPSMLETLFMTALSARMSESQHFEWRRGSAGRIWIAFDVGAKRLWVSTRPPSSLNPEVAIVLASGFSLALAVLAGLALQGWMNKPLKRLNSAARRLSLQTTDERVPVEGPIEFRTLAESFNRMMERLGQGERERNLMLGGISHDLRTPLSKIRLAIEMIDEKAPDPDLKAMIVRQIEVMDGMLAQFLDFARGIDEEEPVITQPDLMVAELCDDTAMPEVRFVERADASVRAKPLALRRAVQNLLQNAIKYGGMPVELRTQVSDGTWTVEVLDHGAGLGLLDGSKAVEPFVRGDEARGGTQAGTGLGLAIVARIAQAHGGKLDLSNAPGKGVRARLSLPLQG